MSSDRSVALPESVTELMAESVAPQALPAGSGERIRRQLLQRVRADACGTPSDTIRSDEGGWHLVRPKVQMKVLRRDSDTVSFLLRLEAGGEIPAHDHQIEEECMVLEGEVTIGELTLSAGDYHLAHRGQPHGKLWSSRGALLFLRGQVRPHHPSAVL